MKTLNFVIFLIVVFSFFTYSFKVQQKKDIKGIKITDADAEWAANKWNGTTLNDLKSGQEIYNNNCDKCHKLFDPKKFSEEKLEKFVPIMAQKKKINLDKKQGDLILKYLITLGRS